MRLIDFAFGLGCALLSAGVAAAFDVEERKLFPGTEGAPTLRIISTGDLEVFEPILLAFQAENPGVTIDYTVTGTSDLMEAIYEDGAVFDLAISSAMDLQMKLANDGFAQSYASDVARFLPDWAIWRQQLFAFTQEPAVMVVSEKFFAPGTEPKSREDVISLLRSNPERFAGRIGTYDVRRSGFGYLMATQDSRNGDSFWRLSEVLGRLQAKLYCCSGEMIRDVANGELALAYNVLGSYSARKLKNSTGFRIVELNDFVNVMLRTVLIPATAENVPHARDMVDFLLTLGRRPDLEKLTGLPGIDETDLRTNPALRPIRFGPGLMVFLDRQKRAKFLKNWEDSLLQNATSTPD